jgi:hypothetical protein
MPWLCFLGIYSQISDKMSCNLVSQPNGKQDLLYIYRSIYITSVSHKEINLLTFE